jgi:type II secretory pathway component PulM
MTQSRFLVWGGLLGLMLSAPHVGLSQPSSDELNALRQEIQSLKEGQKAISNDLQEIKRLLSSRGEERSPVRDINTTLGVVDAPAKGDKQATLTLVEFTDFQ